MVVDLGNSPKKLQKGNASIIPNVHDGQAASFTPMATSEQQSLLQSSRMQHTSLTSGLNQIQEGNVPPVGNSFVADIIGGQQLQPLPFVVRTNGGFAPVYSDGFGNIYNSPPSYNTDDI